MSTVSLMRHAVMATCFGASMAEAAAGSIAVSRRLHVCAPLVPEACGSDGVIVIAPEAARESLDFSGEVACFGNLDAQLLTWLCTEPFHKGCDDYVLSGSG